MSNEKVTMVTMPVSELKRLTAIEEGLEELVFNCNDVSIDIDDLNNLLERG